MMGLFILWFVCLEYSKSPRDRPTMGADLNDPFREVVGLGSWYCMGDRLGLPFKKVIDIGVVNLEVAVS